MNNEIQLLAKKLSDLVEKKTQKKCAVIVVMADEDYASVHPDSLFDDGVRIRPGYTAKLLNGTE